MGTSEPSLQDVLDAVKGISAELTDLKNESNVNFRALSGDMQSIKDHTSAIETRVGDCETNIDHLSYDMECLKQRQLKCNISIGGIPAKSNEDLLAIFNAICTVLNYNCPNELVTGIYRTSGPTKKSIIVQLANDSVKFGILNAKKAKSSILLEELGLNFNERMNEVMINQQLTPFFGNLLYFARHAKKNNEIAECWFTMRGIYIKPQKNSNAVLIRSANELNSFLTPVQSAESSNANSNKRKASQDMLKPPKKTTDTTTTTEPPTPAQKTPATTPKPPPPNASLSANKTKNNNTSLAANSSNAKG